MFGSPASGIGTVQKKLASIRIAPTVVAAGQQRTVTDVESTSPYTEPPPLTDACRPALNGARSAPVVVPLAEDEAQAAVGSTERTLVCRCDRDGKRGGTRHVSTQTAC